MNEGTDTLKQLERAVMLARNGELRWFLGVFCTSKGMATEIIAVEDAALTQAIGNLQLLMRDTCNKTGAVRWEGVEDMTIPEPCEECQDEISMTKTGPGVVVPMSDTMRRAMTDDKPGWAWQYRPVEEI